MPYWFNWIIPQIQKGNRPLIVAHDSTIRVILQKIYNIDESDLFDFNILRATPLVIEFDKDDNRKKKMEPVNSYYLMNEKLLQRPIFTYDSNSVEMLGENYTELWKIYRQNPDTKVEWLSYDHQNMSNLTDLFISSNSFIDASRVLLVILKQAGFEMDNIERISIMNNKESKKRTILGHVGKINFQMSISDEFQNTIWPAGTLNSDSG